MAYDALRTIMPIAGWPEQRAREVQISVSGTLGPRFAHDSPLEEAVMSEPVSGIQGEGPHLAFYFGTVGALSRKRNLGKWQKRWVFGDFISATRANARARAESRNAAGGTNGEEAG